MTLDTGDFFGEEVFREGSGRIGLYGNLDYWEQDLFVASATSGTTFVEVVSTREMGVGNHDYTLTIEELPNDVSSFRHFTQPLEVGTTVSGRNDFFGSRPVSRHS